MMRTALIALFFATLIHGAGAATATGHSGVALAGVVAGYSPILGGFQKNVMALLFDGRRNFAFPAGHTIGVVAKTIVCRAGDVDITARSCALKFGARTVTITGRRANELYATMIEAGVPSDGAAGTIFESLHALSCTINPNEIKQNTGGGASCTFTAGP